MIKKECKWCGKSFVTKNKKRNYCHKSCQMMARKNRPRKQDQLCWTCKNTNGYKCSWFSEEAKPVEGWVAKPTVIIYGGEKIHSYRISKCPQYDQA